MIDPARAHPEDAYDFGSDVSVLPELDAGFAPMTGAQVLGQALFKRLTTPNGSLPFHPEYGEALQLWLNADLTSADLHRIGAAVETQCGLDERVDSVSAAVDFNPSSMRLRVRIFVVPVTGARLALTVSISQLDITLSTEE